MEGYISQEQKVQFTEQLARYPHIRTIAEIGFNAGHSAEHFFQTCKSLQLLASFDINKHPYTTPAVERFYREYENRFVFIQGDSLVKIPEVHEKFPHLTFDLIYIDGCHLFEWALGDLLNAKKIAHADTLIWVDDVDPDFQNEVGAAVRFCERLGYLQIERHFSSNDPNSGPRHWVQLAK